MYTSTYVKREAKMNYYIMVLHRSVHLPRLYNFAVAEKNKIYIKIYYSLSESKRLTRFFAVHILYYIIFCVPI